MGSIRDFLRQNYLRLQLMSRMARARWLLTPRVRNDEFHREHRGYYDTEPMERDRYRRLLELVGHYRGREHWGNVIELGCGEGAFTTELAARSATVLACDVSRVACEMARERCRGLQNVEIVELDLMDVLSLGQADLIVAMDVLEMFSPAQLKQVATRIEEALPAGGMLALTVCRVPQSLQGSRLTSWAAENGDRVCADLAGRAHLKLLHQEFHPLSGEDTGRYYAHLVALFEKR